MLFADAAQRRKSCALSSSDSFAAGNSEKAQKSAFRPFAASPPEMLMMTGDHFLVSPRSTTLKLGVRWDHSTASLCDVDVSAVLLGADGKKLDHVSFGKRATRNNSVVHLGDDKGVDREGDDESVVVYFDRLAPEVTFVMLLLNVYTQSKTLDDIANILARAVDVTDGNHRSRRDLIHFGFAPQPKSRGAALLVLSRRPKKPGLATWEVITLGVPLEGRSHRSVTAEVEAMGARLLSGWLPTANGFRTGGELDPEDRLLQRVQELKERGKHFSSDVEAKEFYAPNRTLNAEANEVASSSSESDDSVTYLSPTRPSHPRVVRQRKTVYSVGRGLSKANIDSDSDQELDEELLASIIPHFRGTAMTRYGDRCYNYGTERIALLDFFMTHRELISSPEFTQNSELVLSTDSDPPETRAEFRLPDAEGPSTRQFMEATGEAEPDSTAITAPRIKEASSKEVSTLPALKPSVHFPSKPKSNHPQANGKDQIKMLNSERLPSRDSNRASPSRRVVKDAFGDLLSKDLKKWIKKLLETKRELQTVPNRRGVRKPSSVPSNK